MTELAYQTFSTPLGALLGVVGNAGLCVLTFVEEKKWIDERMQKYYPGYSAQDCKNPAFEGIFQKTQSWLDAYFLGEFESLPSKLPKLDLRGTPFALRAWQALQTVSIGKMQTYGEFAKKLGDVFAARAVGNAMSQNPIAILVPCHRVVGANGKLTGYRSGTKRKAWLLKHEGVIF